MSHNEFLHLNSRFTNTAYTQLIEGNNRVFAKFLLMYFMHYKMKPKTYPQYQLRVEQRIPWIANIMDTVDSNETINQISIKQLLEIGLVL